MKLQVEAVKYKKLQYENTTVSWFKRIKKKIKRKLIELYTLDRINVMKKRKRVCNSVKYEKKTEIPILI